MSEFECECGHLLSARERHHGCDKCGSSRIKFMDGLTRGESERLDRMEQYEQEGEEQYGKCIQMR